MRVTWTGNAALTRVPGYTWPAALATIALALCVTSFTVEPVDGFGAPFGTFHLWDMPVLFAIIATCGIIAAALAASSSVQVVRIRGWLCLALVAMMMTVMAFVGPELLVSGEQQITSCGQSTCAVTRNFPGAEVVSRDSAMSSAVARSDNQSSLFASPWWSIAAWVMFLGACVGLYRLAGSWEDRLAALSGVVGTAMLFVSFSAFDRFLTETIGQLFFMMLVVELLAATILVVRQRWLYLCALILLGFMPVILLTMAMSGPGT